MCVCVHVHCTQFSSVGLSLFSPPLPSSCARPDAGRSYLGVPVHTTDSEERGGQGERERESNKAGIHLASCL